MICHGGTRIFEDSREDVLVMASGRQERCVLIVGNGCYSRIGCG